METPNVNTLEGKILQVEEYLKKKFCFGLSMKCEVCDCCDMNTTCPDYKIARLVYEERKLDAQEQEAQSESEPTPKGEKKKEVASEPKTPDDDLVASLPKTRGNGSGWSWKDAIDAVRREKPITYNATYKIIMDLLPEGTNPNKGYNYSWALLTKLAERGIIEWEDGKATSPIIWKE